MIKKKRKRRPGGGPKDITTPRLMQALQDKGGWAWYPSHRVAARDLGIPIRSMYRALPRLMASGAVARRYELGEDGRLGFSLSLQEVSNG
jgi:DNA-binding transcriptional regulator PaaX